MAKPAPPVKKPLTFHDSSNEATSSQNYILARCARCGTELLPEEEFYLHRITGMAILCEKHYEKIREVYDV